MKVYIFLLILLLPNISIAKNINIYKECESFFSTSYQEKIKEHTKKFVFTHEFATIDSIHLKIQKGNTSSLAYIDNKDIIFNKNIFSLLFSVKDS